MCGEINIQEQILGVDGKADKELLMLKKGKSRNMYLPAEALEPL